MATFKIHDVFRLLTLQQFVISGRITAGTTTPRICALMPTENGQVSAISILGVEFIDCANADEVLVGLRCAASEMNEVDMRKEWRIGTSIEVA